MTNGQKLRQLRIDSGWTQEKLAQTLHVNKRTVQRWESGERHCPDLVVMLVERLVKVPEKKTKTITLCRWRQTKTHDGSQDKWCSWRDPDDIKSRDSCGGLVTFETEYCEVEVPE